MRSASTDKVRVGVVGAGWWSTFAHIPAIQSHAGAELVAVQRRSLLDARKVASDFGIQRAFADPIQLLDMDDLDAVIIGTTPNVHYAQTRAALDRGLHVLCEKPFTVTAAEAKDLVNRAQEKNLQLLISCPWHFTAHAREAQRLIRSGELGKIRMISVLMTNPVHRLLKGLDTTPTHGMKDVYIEPRPGSYSDPSVAGGGQIYCQVSHAAAYLSFLTGDSPTEVNARFDFDGSVNDIYDVLSIRMSKGTLVSLSSTGATPRSTRNYEVRVYGTEGVILLELWSGTMSHVDFSDKRKDYPPLSPEEIYPHLSPAMNLVDAVLDPTSNQSPGTLGLASMQIIEAAVHSARESGRTIEIAHLDQRIPEQQQ